MTEAPRRAAISDLSLLDAARALAPPGFNRWLVPPCALAIRLCIGMAFYSRGGILLVGITFFGRPLADAKLIRYTFAYEQATMHRRPPTTVSPLR